MHIIAPSQPPFPSYPLHKLATMTSSLLLPCFTPKALNISRAQFSSLPIFSSSLSLPPSKDKVLFSSCLLSGKTVASFSSSFIAKVAVSSEYGQEEEVSGGEEEASFSPDLKLFVGNLPFSVDSAALAGLFERAGNVEMVEVIYDKLTGRSRGFGFVTMSTVEEVEAAAQQFNGYELEGRPLRVNSGPPPPREESRGFRSGGGSSSFVNNANRVYVGNLSWAVDDSSLETLFSEQGKVLEAKVVYDRESGRSRGFGFVTFNSPEEVDNAISSLNGVDLNGRSIRVTVAEAKPRRQF